MNIVTDMTINTRRKYFVNIFVFVIFLLLVIPVFAKIDNESIVDVSVPKLSEDEIKGEDLYNQYCISCHGLNASGKKGKGPPLIHKIYKPNHHNDMSFVSAIRYGVKSHHWPFGDMKPIPQITDKEAYKIIKYLRKLQRYNNIYVE